MINLRILVPESTTNYVLNPGFRYDTTGWNVQGATITRSLDYARFGIASGKVVTAGSAQREGVYYRVSALAGISEPVTVSIYLRGEGKVRLRLDNNVVGGQEFFTQTIELVPERWTRHEVTGFSTGGNDMRLWVESDDVIARAYTFYIDGAQMERKPYSTSYCDGDQPGCRWNVVDSASLSTRNADTREGGRWIPLVGVCAPDNDIYVTLMGGLGMPPIQNQTQSWAQAPGSYYQNQKILDRVVTMNFTVKKENLQSTPPANLNAIHDLRQKLVDLFKSDVTVGDEAFWFEYSETESDRPLYIKFRYDGGLDGSWDVRNGWYNSFVLRLLAVDPIWTEDNQNVMQLTISDTRLETTTFWRLSDNKIIPISTLYGGADKGPGGTYRGALAEAPDGTVYITNEDLDSVYKWDGNTFTLIGVVVKSVQNNTVLAMDVAPDGTLYIAGGFDSVNGVSAASVAKYNPTTGLWSALGSGLSGTSHPRGLTICVAQNGNVYVGGIFTSAGGVSCSRVAYWDGLQWRTVGATSGVSGTVNIIIKGNDATTLFMGGSFLSSNGGSVTYNGVASINTLTNLLSPIGYGLNAEVIILALGKDGTLYAGGSFTASGTPGTNPLLLVAQWNSGNSWKSLGEGLDGGAVSVNSMEIGENGELYVSGRFISSGDIPLYGYARWFQNTWSSMEFSFDASISASATFLFSKQGELFFTTPRTNLVTPDSIRFPAYNLITNEGSTSVFPYLYIKGQGTLRFIGNVKTGQGIYLNLPLLPNEEVFIDFSRGTIDSTARGSLLYSILPASEIRSINLLPGNNEFGVLVTNDVGCIAQLRYTPQHWSADAVMDAEVLN